jgi:FAD:protein FMN transferase
MILVVSRLLSFFLCGLLMAGCNPSTPTIHEIKGEIFGSYFLIKYRGNKDPKEIKQYLDQFFKEFNQEFSTYQPDSVISILNNWPVGKKMSVSDSFLQMLELARTFYDQTNGAFDPTLGPVIKSWGFGGGEIKKSPTESALKMAMAQVGFSHLAWSNKDKVVWKKHKVSLDLNAFAPGQAADQIGSYLLQNGIENFMVDISGEILFKGDKGENNPWVAGIEKPSLKHAQGVQVAFKIRDQAIATSGNYRQFFTEDAKVRAHIIHPKTGRPVNNMISSASVIAPTAAQADAWSTALMVMGEEGIDLAEKHGIKVYLLKAHNLHDFEEILSPSMKTYFEANKL